MFNCFFSLIILSFLNKGLYYATFIWVNEFLAGAGTDAPDVEEEDIISRSSVSYDDMWAKTLLETTEVEVWICAKKCQHICLQQVLRRYISCSKFFFVVGR